MTHLKLKPWQTLFVVKEKNIDLSELTVIIPHLANHDMVLVEMQPRLKAIRKSIRRAIRGPRHPCPPGAVCATCGSKPRWRCLHRDTYHYLCAEPSCRFTCQCSILLISTKICLMLIDTKSHTLLLRASNAGWKNAGNASHTVGDTACGQ